MSREKSKSGGGLQIQTLLLSAVSAVAAATIVPLFWQKGTAIATAMTPVVVALVTEALRRPVERVRSVAPQVSRLAAGGVAGRRFEPTRDRERRSEHVGGRERFDPLPPEERTAAQGVSPGDPFGLQTPPRRRAWWKVGLVTGVLAFLLAAAVVTASELTIFGGSVGGHRGATTIFGGANQPSRHHEGSPAATPAASPQATPTPGHTATPQATTSPAPTASPAQTPTPGAPPQGAAPQATPTP